MEAICAMAHDGLLFKLSAVCVSGLNLMLSPLSD